MVVILTTFEVNLIMSSAQVNYHSDAYSINLMVMDDWLANILP